MSGMSGKGGVRGRRGASGKDGVSGKRGTRPGEKKIRAAALGIAATVLVVAGVIAALRLAGVSGQPPVKGSLEDYSWDQVKAISLLVREAESDEAALAIAQRYHLCAEDGSIDASQTKAVTLTTGESFDVRLIGLRDDTMEGGGTLGLTFCFAEPVTVQSMSSEKTNFGGWEYSYVRSYLSQSLLGLLPSELKDNITPAKKRTNNVGMSESPDAVSETADSLWLLSLAEVYGASGGETAPEGYLPDVGDLEGEQYELFSQQGANWEQGAGVMAGQGVLWLRSPSCTTNAGFALVGSDGMAAYGTPLESHGIVPAFCI